MLSSASVGSGTRTGVKIGGGIDNELDLLESGREVQERVREGGLHV